LATTRTTIVAAALALVVGLVLGLSMGVGRTVWEAMRPGAGAAHAQDATADSDGRMIAVTGAVGSGTSVLWLVDTETKRVSVYRSELGKNLVWVAARNVAHDFKVEGYNDESSKSAEELRRLWEQHALKRPLERPKGDQGAVTEPEKKPGDGKEGR
jgi:hypothetical protein